MSVFRKIRYKIWLRISLILPYSLFICIKFRQKVGYWPDLKHPKTFCEKIQLLKLMSKSHPEFTQMVDKVDAKDYVASIIGEKYIIPTIGVWNHFDDIDFESLPDGYILKCAHDSSKGIVIRDHTQVDIPTLKKRMEHFQKQNYYSQNREYPYKNVPHRIIAERFLVNAKDHELMDYKFFCFNGRAEYVQIISDRTTDETIDFYDRNWKHQEFIGLNPKTHHSLKLHPRPENFIEMFDIADKLSSSINFPFVRIDLYNVNGKIYFGEITFFPASGMGHFKPKEWDLKLGNILNLNR
jgi:hypothetical protein